MAKTVSAFAVGLLFRGEPRPMPQTPWPLVQPAPRRDPNPTSRPATASSAILTVLVVRHLVGA
jgi:hypothetical protein